jgi:phosphatidylglycerophosphate synthase
LRPLVGSPVHPAHITAARLVTGLAACGLFAVGGSPATVWAGALWVLSAFLDRCDGEFARMTGQSSRRGHRFDFASDILINSLVFLAIGLGLDGRLPGQSPLLLGGLAAAGVAVASVLAELGERDMRLGEKTFAGKWGFDFDDIIYIIGPIAWLGGLDVLLVGASVGGPGAAILVSVKLRRKRVGRA